MGNQAIWPEAAEVWCVLKSSTCIEKRFPQMSVQQFNRSLSCTLRPIHSWTLVRHRSLPTDGIIANKTSKQFTQSESALNSSFRLSMWSCSLNFSVYIKPNWCYITVFLGKPATYGVTKPIRPRLPLKIIYATTKYCVWLLANWDDMRWHSFVRQVVRRNCS